ncbi:MAG: serine/threonine protein kinase [Anaerolineae bacterium]|jgi:serine/threonine-protein kinase|nr:serine/threonine protein kinase [Anaerolineae bacterium]
MATELAGRYEMGAVIGEGAWGTVHVGRVLAGDDTVAIKLLKPEVLLGIPEAIERFKREALALRRLRHPNIIRVLEFISAEEQHAIVMEYAGGGSLRDRMDHQQHMPVADILPIARELMSALHSLQEMGIIHRDLKPGNVLFAADGTLRLTDFGLVYMHDLEHITRTGIPLGTTHYLPPEAIKGEKVDARGDLWACGVMLYEMLTGALPFSGRNLAHTLNAIMEQPLPPIIDRRPDCPPALAALVTGLLEKDREVRLGPAAAVLRALAHLPAAPR